MTMRCQDLADPAVAVDLHIGRADLPREALGPRRIDRHILFLIRRGQYAGEIGGRPVAARAGDLLWIPPETPHHLVADGPISKYFLRLRTGARLVPDRPLTRPGPEAEAWCAALLAERHAGDAESAQRVRALLVLLVTAWTRAVSHRPGALPPERRARLLQAVHADPTRRWTRQDLARAVGISPLHLARQVRATFAMPLRRWLVDTRIRAAARDLRDDDVAVGEVARRYGYADGFLFSRQFRLVMGTSPRLWRNG